MNRSLRLLGLTLVLAAAPVVADIHPNLQRGLVPGKSAQTGEIDHVNQFNGNLTLTIPIGSGYPVGGNLGYGLGLVWSGQPWNHLDNGGVWQSVPNTRANAGFGWILSLGRLESPLLPTNDSGSWLYVSPSGSEHKLELRLHDGETHTSGVWYTRDGSYLRMKELGGGLAEVEFPDGAVHRFTTSTGELQQMRDRFGNSATVTTLAGGSWYLSDSTGRSQSIQVNFTADAVLGKRATSVVVKTVGGGTATYGLGYTATTLDRPCIDTDPGTGLITVNLLTSVTLPDGSSYQMPEYHVDQTAGCLTPGAIKSVTLPTLGKIGWTYREYVYPDAGEKFSRTRSNGLATRTTYNASGASLGQWTYTTALDATPPSARQMLNTVTTPLGHKTEHYFSVSRTEEATAGWTKYEYGLPLTRHQADATGTRFLSSRVYNSAGTLLRSSYVAYQRDTDLIGYSLPEATKLNQRLFTTRTVFHDDGGRYADVTHSEFDGLGHYRYTSTGGNFDAGNARTTYRQHNPGNGTYPGSFAMWPTTSPWVLHTVGFEWEAENGVTAARSYAVDANTGWVSRTRIHRLDSGGESTSDVIVETGHDGWGNLATERYYGGDIQGVPTGNIHSITLPQPPQYRVDHTTQYGTRSTSRYIQANGTAMSFLSLDQTIDPSTGAVTVSRDTAALATSYEYDVLGRVRWVKPATGQDGWTEMVYTRATSAAALAKVNVYQRTNGGGTALAESATLFDAFGRSWQEQQKMPNGTFSTRETLYNGVGWRSSVSEQGNTAKRTQFLTYDPFGRPGTIRPPDGSAHDVTLSYLGVRQVHRGVKVATSTTAYTTAWTTELYDRQGRLWRVKEDANPAGTTTNTTHFYDVAGRLVRVQQATAAGTQNRYFVYDRRGFLLSEQHPEKGASGNGSVSYQWYDALGLPGRKVDGPSDLRFTYDRAGRATRIDGQIATPAAFAGLRPIKIFTYGSSNLATNRSNGKLEQATRYNYVDLPFNAEVRVVDTYTFGGRQGRVSTKNTRMVFNGGNSEAFAQSYLYDALGNVTRIDYPDCTAVCGPSSPRAVTSTYANGWLYALPGYASSITYHSNGLYNQLTHANGVVDTQTNDPNHTARPRELVSQRSGVDVWRSGAYQYDGAGNVKKMGNSYFLYDKVSRLVDGHVYDGPTGAGTLRYQTYAYDGFGNLTSVGGDPWAPGRTTGTAAATNRLTSATYDAAGNMTAWNGNTYEYDSAGMMTRAVVSGADWRYMYTADDERFWTYGPGKSTWALRDLDGKVLREYDAHVSWSTFRDYVYRGGQLLASVYPGEGQRQFHLDHVGTPRAVTNSAGTRVAYHAYFAFGEEVTGVAQDSEQMKFTGHERDLQGTASVADDLDYMHARFYNPLLARFLSTDPVTGDPGRPQSWNRYAYVWNSPLNYTDPTGMYGETITVTGTGWRFAPPNDTGLWGLGVLVQGLFDKAFFDLMDITIRVNIGLNGLRQSEAANLPRCGSGVSQGCWMFSEMPLGPGSVASGLRNASPGLKALYHGGSLQGRSIIDIRSTLTRNGFKQSVARNKEGYRFTNKAGEEVRVMRRDGGWDVRVQNRDGNYLDALGNVGSPAASHGIRVVSR
jgi:RHS repeat-associated protein